MTFKKKNFFKHKILIFLKIKSIIEGIKVSSNHRYLLYFHSGVQGWQFKTVKNDL